MPTKVMELHAAVGALQDYVAELAADAGRARHAAADLEERVLKLELRLAEKETGFTDVNSKQEEPRESTVEDTEPELQYKVSESVWDSCVIVGLHDIGKSGSVFLLVSSLLNLFVQGYFCYVLLGSESFNPGGHYQRIVPDMKRWRSYTGHSDVYLDASDSGLVSRVCGNDGALSLAGGQTSLLDEINAYLDMEPEDLERGSYGGTGVKLCGACIFLFAVLVLRELRRVVISARAFAALPRGSCTRVEGNAIVMISPKRLAIVMVVNFLRAFVAVALLYTGARWLSSTSSITELLLNAAGLGFIMDLDEMLFEATVPMRVQNFVRNLAPLHVRRPPLSGEAVFPLIASIGTVLLCMNVFVRPNIEHMLEVKQVLCGGLKEFVVATSPMGFVHSRFTNAFLPSELQGAGATMEEKAVEELRTKGEELRRDGNIVGASQFSVLHDTKSSFLSEADEDMLEWSSTSPCTDLDKLNNGTLLRIIPAFFTTVTHFANNMGLPQSGQPWSCADYVNLCEVVDAVRLVCPVSCGCSDPTSGLFRAGSMQGCPMACRAVVQERLRRAPCTDLDVVGTSNWSRFWIGFANYTTIFDAFVRRKLNDGCANQEIENVSGTRFCDNRDTFLATNGLGTILGFCPEMCCRGPGEPPLDCPADCLDEVE